METKERASLPRWDLRCGPVWPANWAFKNPKEATITAKASVVAVTVALWLMLRVELKEHSPDICPNEAWWGPTAPADANGIPSPYQWQQEWSTKVPVPTSIEAWYTSAPEREVDFWGDPTSLPSREGQHHHRSMISLGQPSAMMWNYAKHSSSLCSAFQISQGGRRSRLGVPSCPPSKGATGVWWTNPRVSKDLNRAKRWLQLNIQQNTTEKTTALEVRTGSWTWPPANTSLTAESWRIQGPLKDQGTSTWLEASNGIRHFVESTQLYWGRMAALLLDCCTTSSQG